MDLTVQTDFIVAALIAVLVLAGYLEWSYARGRLMRRRRSKLAASAARDEAYNASVTSKAIMRNLKAQGYDVSRAEPLVRQSDAELEMGNFTNAKLLAEDAKNTLFEIRSKSLRQPSVAANAGKADADRMASEPGTGVKQNVPPAPKKLPRNYAEASFTLRSVQAEIEKGEGSSAGADNAKRLLAEAMKRFGEGGYDDALRLAVRASRFLSEKENLQPSIQAIPPQGKEGTGKEKRAEDVCSECGAALFEGDSFCRRCGSKIKARCPSCGEALMDGDTFCGNCGMKLIH